MPPRDSLRGQLLVAAPGLDDPNFRRTVILVGEHGDEGAMGVVLQPADIGHGRGRGATDSRRSSDPDDARLPRRAGPAAGGRRPRGLRRPGPSDDLVVDCVGFLPGEIEDAADARRAPRASASSPGYAGWGPGSSRTSSRKVPGSSCAARARDVFTTSPSCSGASVLRREGGALAVLALLPDDPHGAQLGIGRAGRETTAVAGQT